MFELIRANKRRSALLVFVMLFILLSLGGAIGGAIVPALDDSLDERAHPARFVYSPEGVMIGMGVAFIVWIVQAIVAYYQGDRILLRVSRAREISREDHPQLFNVVEEMTIAARLPKMPKIYIIDDMALNAFATGRKPENAAVAVTAGLLGRLNRDQLQGVVAHEISHIVHRDVLFMTMVGIMLGTIVMVSELFLRSLWRGSRTARYSGSRKGAQGQIVLLLIALVLAVLAPILAQFIYFAISRRREYLADAGAAVYTRYPEGIASALEVIAGDSNVLEAANRATAPMFIANPWHKDGAAAFHLTSTHPPIKDRVKVLRSMAGGVSYENYHKAWARVSGGSAKMPTSLLAAAPAVPIRAASPGPAVPPKSPAAAMHEAGDLLRNLNQYIFLNCACGVNMRVPPTFTRDHVVCPRCKKEVRVPVAELAAAGAVGGLLARQGATSLPDAIPVARPREETPLRVTHDGKHWQSFKCPCGAMKNLAPSFAAPQTNCTRCGRKIEVLRPTG